jgi:hypothetical protein
MHGSLSRDTYCSTIHFNSSIRVLHLWILVPNKSPCFQAVRVQVECTLEVDDSLHIKTGVAAMQTI